MYLCVPCTQNIYYYICDELKTCTTLCGTSTVYVVDKELCILEHSNLCVFDHSSLIYSCSIEIKIKGVSCDCFVILLIIVLLLTQPKLEGWTVLKY